MRRSRLARIHAAQTARADAQRRAQRARRQQVAEMRQWGRRYAAWLCWMTWRARAVLTPMADYPTTVTGKWMALRDVEALAERLREDLNVYVLTRAAMESYRR